MLRVRLASSGSSIRSHLWATNHWKVDVSWHRIWRAMRHSTSQTVMTTARGSKLQVPGTLIREIGLHSLA